MRGGFGMSCGRARVRARLGACAAVAAIAALGVCVAGCGGGSGGSGGGSGTAAGGEGSGSTAAGGASAGGAYRWLVPTVGAAPSVAAENAARGTSAWRLPGPASLIGGAAHGAISGYVAEQAIAPSATQSIYVDAPGAGTVRISVYRMGWYGGLGGRLVLRSAALRAVRQPPCAHNAQTGLTECDWHATLSFPIPAALASGVYIAKLRASTGAESDCLFIVRPAAPARVMVQIPTSTYEAYNAWGGDSLYPGGARQVGATGTDQGVQVSYDRPYESQTGAGQFFIREVAIVRFLERYGYPAGYTTDASVDSDPAQLRGARAVIDSGHSEYWSARQEQAFAQARDGGTSLLFISSDKIAWRVRYASAGAASSQAGARGHRIIAYKQFASAEPGGREQTGLFPQGGAELSGSAYDGCITQRVQAPGPPAYRYYDWRPAPSLTPAWLFAGTGITAATRIAGIVGYELDERAPATPAGTAVLGGASEVACMPETEPSPIHGSAAESTLYTARSGALVFATGTLGWLYALSPVPQASPDVPPAPDPRVVAITRNVLERALTRPAG
ncbi:MAG TPA: N,N-dimethylformamidase beta subunit family domain-containing protein [Solirubrobacteraceae bacterium]